MAVEHWAPSTPVGELRVRVLDVVFLQYGRVRVVAGGQIATILTGGEIATAQALLFQQ
jgi:hypothetical protein